MAETWTVAGLAYSIVLRGVHDALKNLPRPQGLNVYQKILSESSLLLSEQSPSAEVRATLERVVSEMQLSLHPDVY